MRSAKASTGSTHRQTTITFFHRYRYMTPAELASVSDMSVSVARRTLNDLRSQGYLVKDGRCFCLKQEPLFYTPLYKSPASDKGPS